MSIPNELVLLGIIFFGFMTVLGVVQARRKKEKVYYASAVGSFLVFLGFIFIFLNQFVLVIVLLGAAFVLSIVGLPRVLRMQERELKEVDLSTPLRFREFLSNTMWLKLAHRWGAWKSVSIFALFAIIVTASVVYIALRMYGVFDIWYILGYTICFTIGSAILLHHQISQALRESKSHA